MANIIFTDPEGNKYTRHFANNISCNDCVFNGYSCGKSILLLNTKTRKCKAPVGWCLPTGSTSDIFNGYYFKKLTK